MGLRNARILSTAGPMLQMAAAPIGSPYGVSKAFDDRAGYPLGAAGTRGRRKITAGTPAPPLIRGSGPVLQRRPMMVQSNS